MGSSPSTYLQGCAVVDGNGKRDICTVEASDLIAEQGAFCNMAISVELFIWPLSHLESPYDPRHLPLAPSDYSRRCLWSPRNTNMACSCIHRQLWSCQQILDSRHVVSALERPLPNTRS